MGINKAIILGNVGRDPEARQVGENTVVNFSVATSDRRFKDPATGKPRTEWHNVVAWGKLAGIIAQYVTKGSMVYIEGRIQTRSWEDKEGNKRYTTEVVADQLEMLGGGQPRAEKEDVEEGPDDAPF